MQRQTGLWGSLFRMTSRRPGAGAWTVRRRAECCLLSRRHQAAGPDRSSAWWYWWLARLIESSHSCREASHVHRAWQVGSRPADLALFEVAGPRRTATRLVQRRHRLCADRRRIRYRLVGPTRQTTSLLDLPTRPLPARAPARDDRSQAAPATTATHCRPTRILGRHQLRVAHRVSSVSTRPPAAVSLIVCSAFPVSGTKRSGLWPGLRRSCDRICRPVATNSAAANRFPPSGRMGVLVCDASKYCERASAHGCPGNRWGCCARDGRWCCHRRGGQKSPSSWLDLAVTIHADAARARRHSGTLRIV